jgi:hypothetical protein
MPDFRCKMYELGLKSIFIAKLFVVLGCVITLFSLCKKTPTTALLSFLKQSFTTCKLLGFKNFENLAFGAFLSKTENFVVILLALFKTCWL